MVPSDEMKELVAQFRNTSSVDRETNILTVCDIIRTVMGYHKMENTIISWMTMISVK